MKRYRFINNISGWAVFLIATVTYLLTLEPTASLWDCGEFIASGFKLEVGHPPGNPVFMVMARFFTLFAGGDVSKAAVMVNAMSGIVSAFTILFLFWTITHLARKIIIRTEDSFTMPRIIAVVASGAVGALAYTFSDSFWFSASEGEVYAMSATFTAITFWAILKWEIVADEKHSLRWLILIAFLIGLTIGIHLLNLLAIPAITFVYYFRKYKPTRKGMIIAGLVSVFILFLMMYIFIPGIVKLAGSFELFFVNSIGIHQGSGLA